MILVHENIIRQISRLLIFVLMLCIFFCFCACGKSDRTAVEVLRSVINEYDAGSPLPAGAFYTTDQNDAEGLKYLSGNFAMSLYGNDLTEGYDNGREIFPEEFSYADDYAVFICSTDEPYEFAVFRTRAASDTTELAKMLHRRLQRLKKYWHNSEYAERLESAVVQIQNNYVIFAVCESR